MMRYEGIGRLSRQMNSQTQRLTQKPMPFDIGKIKAGFVLHTNSFDIDIPPEDYLVGRSITVGKTGEILSGSTTIPEKLRSLKVGDSVLVAWVGADAVVIDIILPAKEVTK